jgi:hypothetical protein
MISHWSRVGNIAHPVPTLTAASDVGELPALCPRGTFTEPGECDSGVGRWIVLVGNDPLSLPTSSTVVPNYYQNTIERSHRRYLAGIKMFAVVRKLALPVLITQVNIAENKQQVNNGVS